MIQSKLAAIDLEELSDIDSEEGEEKLETSASYLPTIKPVDLRHAYSTFQSVRKVPLPYDWESKDGYGLTKEMWGIIQHSPLWTIRKHKNNVPIPCISMPPCVPATNTYSIFAGKMTEIYVTTKDEHNLDKKTVKKIETIEEIMRVDEVSSEYNRLCCRPYHPFKLEFRQYIPLYGDSTMSSYEHLEQKDTKQIKEYYNQWKFSSAAMQLGMKDLYNAQPVLFTMVRDDGQRWPYPLYTESNGYCKCLYAPSLYPCSQDGAKMYVGEVKETAHEVYQKGRHCKGDDNDKKLMGSVVQPKQGIYPMLHLRADRQRKEDEPFGKHEGPCCFGGFLEVCCAFRFSVYRFVDDVLPEDYNADEGSDEKKTLVSFAKCTQLLGCLFPVKNGSSKESKDQSKDEVSEADENAMYIWIMKCLFPPKVIRYRLATIGKRHPRKVMGPTTDLYADVDEYTIAFNEDEEEYITPSQKMVIIGSQLLADYNYFNGATEMCSNSEQALTCYFFYCSPYGCVQPCCCLLPKQQ